MDVLILARNAAKAAEVAFVAGARAAIGNVPATFRGQGADVRDVAGVLGEVRPDVLIQCASQQSPWERTTAPSPWTELIAAAGFGITLPLQSALVLEVADAVRRVVPECRLINACFPDAVNPVLHALDLPVLCGMGNISTVAAAVRSALESSDHSAIHVLAHHVHLHAPDRAEDEARIWCAGTERDGVGALLSTMRSASRAELNLVGGHAAALLVAALVDGAELDTHVPGPLGLPGGYPVRVAGGRVELRLPPGVDAESAMAWNQRMSTHDGVVVADGMVRFSDRAAELLEPHLPRLARGFPVSDLDRAAAELLDLRERLRTAPS